MTDKIIRVGLGAIALNEKGQFLMGKRVGNHGTGTWAIPGGYLEFGESFEEGAARELMEEAGLVLKDIKVIAVANQFFGGTDKHHISIYCIGRTSGEPQIREPDKMVEWQFFDDWNDMPQPTFVPYAQNVAKELIEEYKEKAR